MLVIIGLLLFLLVVSLLTVYVLLDTNTKRDMEIDELEKQLNHKHAMDRYWN